MSKKQIITGGVGGFIVLCVVLSILLWPKHKPVTQQASNQSSSSTNDVLGQNSADSGLSVSGDNQAADLGQLGDGTNQTGNGGSDNSSQKSPFDPSTFAQYDKYKDDQNGLFADVQKGTGTELASGMKAAVYYKGWLTNGTLFDQSQTDDKGQLQPFVFTLGAHQVIPGWEEALVGMKVGGVRLVIVPPAAGYGDQAQGSIPANSVLIFQVQLAAAQ